MTHWVSFGHTESGDSLAPIIWDRKPTYDEVSACYRENYPDEYEECGGVHHQTTEALESAISGEMMRKALTRIATAGTECGCKPCTGQCRSKEALEYVLDEVRETARAALATPAPQQGEG